MNATPPAERLRVLLPHLPDESVVDAARILRALFDPACVHLRRVFVQRPLGQEVFLSSAATAAEISRIERDAWNATRVQSEHDMLTLVGEGFEVSADVLGGSPRAEVLRDAELWPADLVVVRAQQAGHDENRLGQMASALLHHAPCPVLLHHEVPQYYAVRRLLVPVDFSAASRRAARWGLAFASLIGARADLLHVVDESAAAGKVASADLVRAAREEVDSWRARLASATLAADVTIAANPGDGILGYAGHREHDLIVLPATGRSEVAAVLLGSTVRRVVRGTSVPVLVLPATNRVPPEPFFARAAGERVAAPA